MNLEIKEYNYTTFRYTHSITYTDSNEDMLHARQHLNRRNSHKIFDLKVSPRVHVLETLSVIAMLECGIC